MVLGANRTYDADEITGVALQDDLMRFEGRFSSRLVGAFEPLIASKDPSMAQRAARDELDFMSAALDIAVGSSPEVDLLDMVTLVALGRDAMAGRWNVDVHGDAGRRVIDAFEASLEDISRVGRTVISTDIEARLHHVIREWQSENPDQRAVAAVRLSAYTKHRDGTGVAKDARGLFSLVRGAARTADTAVLLGERALYTGQRLPFLVRMHAHIASNDAIASGMASANATITRVERAVKRILLTSFFSFSGIALAAAASWLVASAARALFPGRK
jgi:hypothetical protein